jgi:hypothetical protein
MSEEIKNTVILVGAVVGILGFAKGLYEYSKQTALKRAENYLKLREKYKESSRFKDLFEMLETDDEKLRDIPYEKKQDFLGFYEDIALFMNSGMLKPEVAHYMFSYHAIKCSQSKNFWSHEHINKTSPYWGLFNDFVAQMLKADAALNSNPSIIKNYRI